LITIFLSNLCGLTLTTCKTTRTSQSINRTLEISESILPKSRRKMALSSFQFLTQESLKDFQNGTTTQLTMRELIKRFSSSQELQINSLTQLDNSQVKTIQEILHTLILPLTMLKCTGANNWITYTRT